MGVMAQVPGQVRLSAEDLRGPPKTWREILLKMWVIVSALASMFATAACHCLTSARPCRRRTRERWAGWRSTGIFAPPLPWYTLRSLRPMRWLSSRHPVRVRSGVTPFSSSIAVSMSSLSSICSSNSEPLTRGLISSMAPNGSPIQRQSLSTTCVAHGSILTYSQSSRASSTSWGVRTRTASPSFA